MAWRDAHGEARQPREVLTLKAQKKAGHKSAVFRLRGAGPDGRDIIAKRCRAASGRREQLVYETILPRLPVPTLRYYGSAAEAEGGYRWLFLEDAGDTRIEESARPRFMSWLAEFHVSAAEATAHSGLESSGSLRYLDHLRSCRARIVATLDATHFSDPDRALHVRILRMVDLAEEHWSSIVAPLPEDCLTLTHGDLSSKNVRVCSTDRNTSYRLLDWETAERAVPAADLGALAHSAAPSAADSLEAYRSVVSGLWGWSRSDMEVIARIGAVFRTLASLDWASYSLPYEPAAKPMAYFRTFERRLAEELRNWPWGSRL